MKQVLSDSCSLKDFKKYQNIISQLNIGDKLQLKIIRKENGYDDVFALTDFGKIAGELFSEESRELFYYVKYPEHFSIEVFVKKMIPKPEDTFSVVIDYSVFCLDDFDYENFIAQLNNQEEPEFITDVNHSDYDSQFWMQVNGKWKDIRKGNDKITIETSEGIYNVTGKEYELFVLNNGKIPDSFKTRNTKSKKVQFIVDNNPQKVNKTNSSLGCFSYFFLVIGIVFLLYMIFGR